MRPSELLGADFIGYDAPPAIVAKPGESISLPIFVSHYSERTGPVKVRWWASGYDEAADIRTVVEPRNVAITWKPYDVVNLEPLKFKAPNFPLVGAVLLTLRDANNQRFAANFVNLVVKPDRPSPRIERRGPKDVVVRFARPISPVRVGPSQSTLPRARSTAMARASSSTGYSCPLRS